MEVSHRQLIEDLEVPSSQHKYLIGRKGTNVRWIRESTGARIIFPQIGDPNADTIQVTGTSKQIEFAKLEIFKFLDAYKSMTQVEIEIDPKWHDYFIRRNGEICNEITNECGGVLLCFPTGAHAGVSSKVILKGQPHFIDKARRRIATTLDSISKLSSVEVIIPQKFHATVIGRGGMGMTQLENQYNVHIKFPPKADHSQASSASETRSDGTKLCDIIVITGMPPYHEIAKKQLLLRVPKTAAEWKEEESFGSVWPSEFAWDKTPNPQPSTSTHVQNGIVDAYKTRPGFIHGRIRVHPNGAPMRRLPSLLSKRIQPPYPLPISRTQSYGTEIYRGSREFGRHLMSAHGYPEQVPRNPSYFPVSFRSHNSEEATYNGTPCRGQFELPHNFGGGYFTQRSNRQTDSQVQPPGNILF